MVPDNKMMLPLKKEGGACVSTLRPHLPVLHSPFWGNTTFLWAEFIRDHLTLLTSTIIIYSGSSLQQKFPLIHYKVSWLCQFICWHSKIWAEIFESTLSASLVYTITDKKEGTCKCFDFNLCYILFDGTFMVQMGKRFLVRERKRFPVLYGHTLNQSMYGCKLWQKFAVLPL